MTHIQSRKHAAPQAHARLLSTTLTTALALAVPAAHAADTPGADDAKKTAATLDKVEVHGLHNFVTSPKFTQTLQDTPQTIQVIGEDLIKQQGATTLTEALRNSAGVGTFYAGENGNTSTGDALYMRGFDTSSSIFVDGVRDLGSISRDTFNIEQIEVVKGPASTDTGRSAPTGAINLVSKQANLNAAASATAALGIDRQRRASADWNTRLGENAALRLNAMWQDSDVVGRDHVNNSRIGFAPSLGLGLNGATRVWLNLLYVKQDNVPDGFVPTIGLPGWSPQPGLEALVGKPVNPSNFYGTRADHDDVTAKMATLRLEHDISEHVTLSNTLRWGSTDQDYLLTAFMSTSGNITKTNPSDPSSYTLKRSIPTFKDQQNRILTNQFNVRMDANTGSVLHFISTGLELSRETLDSYPLAATNGSSWSPANLYAPDWNATGLSWAHNGTYSHGRTQTASLYAFDTLKFGEHLLVTAGLRADRYRTTFNSASLCGGRGPACGSLPAGSVIAIPELESKDTLINGKLGALYKFGDKHSLYANWAISQQPPGGASLELNSSASNANNPKFEPQKARTLELGSKWSLLGDALALNFALFDTTVSNEIAPDPTTTGSYVQTGRKSVKGVEISAVGSLSEHWTLSAGLSHLDTEVEAGSLVSADGSTSLTYTPNDAATLWSTYTLPGGLSIGGGARYTGALHRGKDGAVGTPVLTKSYTVWDALLSYPINEHLTLRLNGYNLFNKAYIASINKSGYRYTPGTPRTFLLSADIRF